MWDIDLHKQCPLCKGTDISKIGEHFQGQLFVEKFRCNRPTGTKYVCQTWEVDENGTQVY